MHAAFAPIQFGPFASTYHRALVNDAFKEQLSAYLVEELLPQVVLPFESTAGSLKALYDNDKHCGEKSAVRNLFELRFQFRRTKGDDAIVESLRFEPVTGRFGLRNQNDELCLVTVSHHRCHDALKRLWKRVLKGEAVDEPCPQCRVPLRSTSSPSHVSMVCPTGCATFDYQRDSTGKLTEGNGTFRPRRMINGVMVAKGPGPGGG